MKPRKRLAIVPWIVLTVLAGAMAVPASPAQAQIGGGTTSRVTDRTPGNGDAPEAQAIRDAESCFWSDGSDHWALYQRLADRSEPDAPIRPDFSGDWVLNAEASDDPREKAKQAMRPARQARGGGLSGGRHGRAGAVGMDEGGGLSSGELSALLAAARELHITHQDPMLLIADEGGRRQRLYTDVRGASVSASGGLQQRVAVAGWEGAGLVIEMTMRGNKLVQRYQFDGGTGSLVISTVAQVAGAQPVSYRLVYDRRKPGADGERARQSGDAPPGETR